MTSVLNRIRIFAIFATILMLGTLATPVSAYKGAANGVDYTPDELYELYHKYNITENDIKFAEGRLPHYLEGTALDGKVLAMGRITLEGDEVVVTEWIDPLAYEYFSEKGFKVMSHEEWLAIEEGAIERYIERFGVDPANPKIDIVDGVPLPTEYVRELVKSGKISPGSDAEPLATTSSSSSSPEGPYARHDRLHVWIVAAANPEHKPTQAYLTDTVNALGRFFQFGVGAIYFYHVTTWWDASDVSPPHSAHELRKDIIQDMDGVRDDHNDKDPVNDIVMGWVNYMNHNGIACGNGFFSVCAVMASGVNWRHDIIAQHEIAHNFNAPCHAFWPVWCVMSYWAAAPPLSYDGWCTDCWWIVWGNINGVWE